MYIRSGFSCFFFLGGGRFGSCNGKVVGLLLFRSIDKHASIYHLRSVKGRFCWQSFSFLRSESPLISSICPLSYFVREHGDLFPSSHACIVFQSYKLFFSGGIIRIIAIQGIYIQIYTYVQSRPARLNSASGHAPFLTILVGSN